MTFIQLLEVFFINNSNGDLTEYQGNKAMLYVVILQKYLNVAHTPLLLTLCHCYRSVNRADGVNLHTAAKPYIS